MAVERSIAQRYFSLPTPSGCCNVAMEAQTFHPGNLIFFQGMDTESTIVFSEKSQILGLKGRVTEKPVTAPIFLTDHYGLLHPRYESPWESPLWKLDEVLIGVSSRLPEEVRNQAFTEYYVFLLEVIQAAHFMGCPSVKMMLDIEVVRMEREEGDALAILVLDGEENRLQ